MIINSIDIQIEIDGVSLSPGELGLSPFSEDCIINCKSSGNIIVTDNFTSHKQQIEIFQFLLGFIHIDHKMKEGFTVPLGLFYTMEKEDKDLKNSNSNTVDSDQDNLETDEQENIETNAALQDQLTEAYSKNESLQSKYLRTFADLENLKRSIRDREEAIQRSRLQLIEDLLPSMDAFSMGMDEAEKVDPDGPIVNGFKMAINQMQSILEEYGLVCIDGVGESFDPKLHEAIGHEIGPDEDLILKVIRKGYRLRDHLIRPATVIVSKKKKVLQLNKFG